MGKDFHGYWCEGCGHTTVTDKYYRYKLMHCAVCGHQKRMTYLSKYKVEPVKENRIKKGEM